MRKSLNILNNFNLITNMTDPNEGPTTVVSAFIERDGKYLLIYDPRFEFWRVPDGRPKSGEEVEEGLKREMKEELNIGLEVEDFLGFGQDNVVLKELDIEVNRLLLYFECEIEDGEVEVNVEDEIEEMKWLEIDEIKNHKNLEPGMEDFFERFDYKWDI